MVKCLGWFDVLDGVMPWMIRCIEWLYETGTVKIEIGDSISPNSLKDRCRDNSFFTFKIFARVTLLSHSHFDKITHQINVVAAMLTVYV